MIFELNIKRFWQHPATSNKLEITKSEWNEASDPIVKPTNCLSQLQPRIWNNLPKPKSEVLTTMLPALQEFTKFTHFTNTHLLTRYSVKQFLWHCQFLISDNQGASLKGVMTNLN